MKEKFSAAEWENLKLVPFVVFQVVCGADGRIDQKEVAEFARRMTLAPAYKDEAHRELMMEIAGDFEGCMARGHTAASDGSRAATVITDAAAAMRSKLTPTEHEKFGASLIIDGIALAGSSGGGLFGGKAISGEEAASIAVVAVGLGVDVDSIKKHYS